MACLFVDKFSFFFHIAQYLQNNGFDTTRYKIFGNYNTVLI